MTYDRHDLTSALWNEGNDFTVEELAAMGITERDAAAAASFALLDLEATRGLADAADDEPMPSARTAVDGWLADQL